MAGLRNLFAAAIPTALILGAGTYVVGSQMPPRSIERGREIYAARCAGCHGVALQGQANWRHVDRSGRLPAPPLDGTGHAWMHSDEELAYIIAFSVLDMAGPGYETDMPTFRAKLGDQDIEAIVAFIRSRWPNGMQAAQSFLNPDHAGMPAHVDPNWRLPADCEEPLRRASSGRNGP